MALQLLGPLATRLAADLLRNPLLTFSTSHPQQYGVSQVRQEDPSSENLECGNIHPNEHGTLREECKNRRRKGHGQPDAHPACYYACNKTILDRATPVGKGHSCRAVCVSSREKEDDNST